MEQFAQKLAAQISGSTQADVARIIKRLAAARIVNEQDVSLLAPILWQASRPDGDRALSESIEQVLGHQHLSARAKVDAVHGAALFGSDGSDSQGGVP
jgi:hypothetical protein